MANIILVTVKVEDRKSGSVTIACNEMRQDALFPSKVILMGVQGLSWPFEGHWVKVQQWSIDKDGILNWMLGPVQNAPDISEDMLTGEEKPVPWPPGSLPNQPLANVKREIDALVEEPPPPAAPAPTDPPPAILPVPPATEPALADETLTMASSLPGDAPPPPRARKGKSA